jgi:hypothetical protein
MYRGNIARSYFSTSTPTRAVEMQKLKDQKNQLLTIVANYLKKTSDRATTLSGLTSLEQTLAKPS